MTYTRFEQIWTTLVVNRAPSSSSERKSAPLYNGVSERTVDALVAEADGDHSIFDSVEQKLANLNA